MSSAGGGDNIHHADGMRAGGEGWAAECSALHVQTSSRTAGSSPSKRVKPGSSREPFEVLRLLGLSSPSTTLGANFPPEVYVHLPPAASLTFSFNWPLDHEDSFPFFCLR